MDIATSLGLLAGVIVLCTLILMGGDLRMFLDAYAAIVIFGGAFAATLIRFPLSSIFTPRMSIPRKHRRRHLPTNDRQQAYSARFKEDRKFSLASA
jgi:flagellar motor component MotA